MVSKNNIEMRNKKMRDEKQRFSIRKFSVGAASVLIGLSFSLYNGQQASADTVDNSNKSVVENTQDNDTKDNNQNTDTQNNENKTNTTQTTVTDNLDHGTVVASYKADTNASETSKSNVSTENKQDEKQTATTETATAENNTEQVESKSNANNAVNEKSEKSAETDNADVNKAAAVKSDTSTNVNTKNNSTNTNADVKSVEAQTIKTNEEKAETTSADLKNTEDSAKTETSTNTLNVNEAVKNVSLLSAKAANESKAVTLAAEAEDSNAVTVSDAKGLIDAIQNGTATTINVANDINLATVTDSNYTYVSKINTRDITIKSATDGVKHTIDFSGYVFNMSTPNTVTFKDLNIYARSYWGVVYNAGGYVYDNVDFIGSQLIYTASNTNATVTFKNKVTATAVGSYTSPIDGKSRSSQGGNTQQILQFAGGTNQIIFDENSDVTLGTTNSNVLEIDGGTATIEVKNGADVTINPHSKGNPENLNGIGTGAVARAIASNANTTINVDKGATLTVNIEKASGDSDVAGALYLSKDANLNVNGDLNINSNGTPSTRNNGYPVYIAGNAAINVGNGGKFNLAATNLGSYSSNLMSINGKGTVKLDPHSSFNISTDGTGAVTAINLSSGSTFTSDQPDAFTIDLSANTSDSKALIKNGTINFSRVKTVATDGTTSEPLGKIDVTYDKNGNATSYTITAQDENTVKQVADGLTNKSLINLVQAGEDVTLSNLHLSKDNVLTGTVASSGSDNPIYVTVTVGGVSTNVPVAGNYTVYTNTNGTVTSDTVDYAAQTGSTGGNFSIDLSKLASSLTDDANVTVTATKDFVESAQTESVAALRALDTTTLKELVDAAPDEEKKASYYNASEEAQKAYTEAVSAGQTILDNPNNYDQVDVDNAVTAIQNAQKALTGEPTNKTELQAAVDAASTVESSDNYTNADSNLQKAYTDAISAGQTVLSNANATQAEVNKTLTTINNAKDALNGDAKKAASKEALQKAVDEASTVRTDDAAYYNGTDEAKTAYDNAISAGQKVLDNSDATATQITDALTAINTAKSNLNGKATDKSSLQTAVDNSVTVKESNNYTNADETQKTAYDNAVTAAQAVLDKTNATQAEVSQALQDLETANNNLNGDAKTEAANKAALEAAVKDAPNVRNTPAYYNGSEEAQTAYNNAINAGQAVLDQANPSASDVKTALDAINTAKANLKGEATNTAALETALTNANNAKETGNYTNADQAKQEALNNAITAGQEILKNTSATQAQVASAAKAITDAISGLNGDTNLTNAKNAATEDIQKVLDTKTTEITDATNIDQATKDQLIADAKKAAEDATTAINQATDANAVNTAKTEGIMNINNVTVPSLDDAKTNAAKEIDQALTDKTKEINNAENIDQTTKDQLIKEATDAANTAKDAIEKATTNDDVATEQAKGIDAINNVKVPSVTDSQNAAKDAIDDALNAKTKEINNATNIDQTTKDQLIKEATDAANNAKEAIDKATTADAIKTAQDEGTTNINNVTVPSLEDAKKAANEAVENALTAQTEVINSATNLSDAEKKDLIDKATAEANNAKENIKTATTNNEAAQAGQAGVDAIKNIVPTSLDTVKSDANKAIDDALTKKLKEINSANDLTTDEKTALTQEANTAADKAKEEITNATTNDAVIEAQTNGVTAIDGIKVPTESAVKEAAKKAVADAATAKNNAIDTSNLTNEEKAALKQKVTEAQKAADQAIDNATTNAAVTEAQTNAVNAINGIEVPNKSDAKEKAITDLNTAAENAKKAIDQDSNLTDEQKQAAKDQIDSDAKSAQEAINNAKTNDDVKKAVNDGTLAIDKDAANAAIDNAVAGKKNEISKSSLTDEEKTALNNEVDQKAQAAKEAINTANTPEAVTSAQNSGVKDINDTSVPAESDAKEAAKNAVAKAAEEKNATIDSSNLTEEEKAALKKEVTEAQNAADQAIDSATTNAAVTEAKDNGISAIDGITVPTTSANKEKAITDLNNEVENAKKAIDQDNNLTDEEKQAVKDQIDSDAKSAQDAINNAKTDNDVNNAVDNGKVSIDKDVANAAIDNAVAGKLKEIQDPLTTEEKQAYTDLINSEATNAKQNIANATTVEEVTTAQTNGVNKITNIEIPTTSSAKEKAIAAINDALQTKTDEINNASNINTQEKTDLINQATEAANAAKNNINNATTNADVDTAQTNGEKAIADVTVPNLSDVKKESIDLINKALDAKTNEINNASNLSQDEKQGLINDATNAATEAINNVNEAQTNDDAKAAATTGVQNIENITIPTLDEAKKNANQAIDDALNSKVNEINNASNLNDAEKQKLVDQANEAATTAKNNVEKATTNDAARDAANAGIENIKGITFTSLEDAKDAANTAIDNALKVKTDEINNASNLSTDEKQDLINQATEVAKNAKDNINNATTNDAVTEAQNKGIADIANVTVPSLDQVKQDAINAVKQVQYAKNKQISAASNLSAEEQKELSDQVDKIANDAIAKINDSSTTTNDAVTATRDDAIKQITDLFIPTLDGAQTDALNAIESAKNAKLNDINNAAHLTDEEKQALVDQTNKAADDATKEIKAAQTNDAVKSAETAGLENINNITIPTLVQKQQEAIEELNTARDAKNSAIDDATDLTTDEKNSLKDKVQAKYSNAVSNITSATTDEAVTTAKENGIAAIKDIEIPTKSAAKEQATTDLNNEVEDAKKAIDQDNNLTDEEKQAAKDQIDSDAKKAQEAIDNATTDDEVNTAVDNGKLAIDKDTANAAIDNEVAGKKAEISKSSLTDEEKAALNNEVDQKAEEAKEAIKTATTPEAVTTAQENGIKNINDTEVPTESAAKETAKKAVAEAAEAKNNAIDSSDLTNEEKAALKQEVADAQNAADRAIDAATTNTAVTEAQDNGIKAIDNVTVPTESAAKETAKKAIAEAAEAKNNAIDSSNLTGEEKATLKQEVAEAQNAANTAIDNATTNAAVTEAEDNGIKAINSIEVPTKSDAKEQATIDLNTVVDEAKKAIDQDSNLTDEEKQAAKDQIDSDAKKAQDVINNAKTNDDVKKAVDNGKLAIDKDVANAAIDNAVAGKKEEISKSSLTDEEKNSLNTEVDEKADAAKNAINAATTPEAVTTAQESGVKNINDVAVPTESTAKQAAKDAVAKAADEKNKAIDSSNLTDEEKAALKKEVSDAQNAADSAIDNATTNAAVTEAQNNGVNAIDNVTVPNQSAVKEAAKEAVAKAADEKNKAIDSSNLTDEEKAALKQEVSDAQNAADSAIDSATTNAAVTEAQDNGVDKINSIEVPSKSTTKDQATTDLNNEVDEAKKAIDQDSNLTDEQKQAAKDQIESDAKKAQEAIDNAKTNDDVKNAINDGTLAIDKDVANAVIDNAVAGKKEEISKSPLTDEEKTALNNEVDEKANTAKDAINAATTPEAVTTAQDSGIKNIDNTEVPSKSTIKEAAKEAVAKAAEAKNKAIDASSLTTEEKAALKKEVSDAQAAANSAIDSATTNAAVTEAQNDGIDKINSIDISAKSAAKEQATTDLNNEVDEAKKAIDQDSNLTDEQKQAAKDQIDSDAKKAQDAINSAKTNDEVKKAVDDGKLAIDKDVANAAIDDAAAGKLKEINNSLTNDEKQTYTDLINNEAETAKQKIADATTPEAVDRAQEEGVKDINNINVPTTSPTKDAANAAIDQALKNKKNEINNATNISSQEKADLIKQATDIATTAKENINNATTNSEVETAQVDGEKAITDVTVPGLSDIKKEGIDLINKALDEKQNEINNASSLSQDEKQDLIDQAKKIATDAINSINNAQTNDEAKQATDTGVKNIENVSIPSLDDAKKNATQAIDDALNSKKNEINNASNLTDSEKADLIKQVTDIANTAKDTIKQATTNTAVKNAEDKGVADINNVNFTNLEDSKKAANNAIDDALNAKKDEINNASNLTDSEKTDLINQVTDIAQKAHDEINQATTNSAVKTAENKGIENIANVNVPSLTETKQAAIDAIKQVQNAKNSQIEAVKNLSADEQTSLINQVNKIAQEAISKLNDSATTTDKAITEIRDQAIDQITNLFIPTLDSAQKDAQEAINSAKEAKINEINKAANLTQQEKQNLIDQVNKVADKAITAINNAQTNNDVKEAETKGLEDISNIQVPSLVESKDQAIKEIDDALKKKTDEINASDLDQKQKEELISQITKIAVETKSKVFNATTNAEVNAVVEAGVKAIEAVQIPTRTINNDTEDNKTPNIHTEENNTKQTTDKVSKHTENENKEQTVITNSVRPKKHAVPNKKNASVTRKATLPQTGKKSNSNLTLAGAALLGLASVFSLFGLGDKRKKNK